MKFQGLSELDASERINQWGYNEVIPHQSLSLLNEIKKILMDPMGLMLLILSTLYWILGDRSDAIILLIAFFPVTAVDVILGFQSRKALKALSSSLSLNAKLIRDGIIKDIFIRNIVPNDLIVFEEGQVLPADGLVLESEGLSVSEAALTGESIPVFKNVNDSFFGGTTILSGRGVGEVQKTGKNSRFGSIAKLMSLATESRSPLQKRVAHLVRVVVLFAICFAILLFSMEWFRTHQFIPSLIIALTLGMAAVPEEFPLVFTLYLSLGAWRLSKSKILVKSLPCVEALGGVDVICTDKTGTLTEGIFHLDALLKTNADVTESQAWLIAEMACEPIGVDSLEIPIIQKAKEYTSELDQWELLVDYPFEIKNKTMSHVWKKKTNPELTIAMKGAAEGVIAQCLLDAFEKAVILNKLNELSSQGKRVLGLASKSIQISKQRKEDESELNFIGFLVFNDPIRVQVKEAIQKCQDAGIQIKILTGDHLLTAHFIADQIGLNHSHQYLFTGEIINELKAEEKIKAYLNGGIFARVTPEQKLELVQALQGEGKIVAMTGDGINDAPALKLADIGISMGKMATDVARASAKMVLLESDFSGIVKAVFEGRKIFANLRRSFSYLISFHIPVILLALLPPFFGWPSILMPVHIILLELVVHPVSAFTFENITSKDPEKNTQGALLSRRQIFGASASGLLLSFLALIIFGYFKSNSSELARSGAVATVLYGNVYFVLANVFPLINRRFYITAGILTCITIGITQTNLFASLLHFAKLNFLESIFILVLAFIAVLPGFILLTRKPAR